MPRWMKPTEELPEVEVGDRIVMIVLERLVKGGPIVPRLVILAATETGWESPDPTYAGYTPHDGALWSLESDICRIASVVKQAPFHSPLRQRMHMHVSTGISGDDSCAVCGLDLRNAIHTRF